MEQNVTLSANSVLSLRKAVAFNDGFNRVQNNSDSQGFLKTIEAIQGNLAQYGKLLESLSSSYSALGDLASYDAAGNFNSSIATLATDAKNFASTVGKPIEIPTEVTSGVKAAGGIAIGLLQAGKVKDGSKKIETVLKEIISVLDNPDTRVKLIPVQGLVTGQIDEAAVTLFAKGVYSYTSLLDDLGAPLNLKSTSASDTIVSKDSQVQAGLRNVAAELAQEQVSSQAASYDRNLAALKALVPLHESLQHGAPLNLATIVSVTGQLQSIAASLQPPKGR
jgi:hypothetical protein